MDKIVEPSAEQLQLGTLLKEVVLASSSPNRKKLIENCGINVRTFSPSADESTEGYTTEEAMLKNARVKMEAYLSSEAFDDSLYAFSADTLVSLDGILLGKPVSEDDAKRMLSLLSGKRQTVYTGCAIYFPSQSRMEVFCDRADVIFRNLEEDEILSYLSSGEWNGAAGAYRLQKTGASLIDRIDGDWTTVVGLPVKRIIEELTK